MATNFESIYEKFLLEIDDYELGLIQDYELGNLCFGYLEKAKALYFPQCEKDLNDVVINKITYINGVRIEPVNESIATGNNVNNVINENNEIVETEIPEGEDATEVPSEPTEEPTEGVQTENEELIVEDETVDTEPLEDDYVFVAIEGYFNADLTGNEQYILALGMKKAWLSSKKFSADLMSKDIGDRDYRAVQGFNYIKELRNLDLELEEEIRRYGVQYTYSIDELSSGW